MSKKPVKPIQKPRPKRNLFLVMRCVLVDKLK